MKKLRFILSNILVIALLVAIGFISLKAFKEMQRKKQIEKEISDLKAEAEKVRKDNQDLTDKITYFESPEFQEWEAKRKLNFQKPDENVVIVKPSPSKADESGGSADQAQQGTQSLKDIPNYIKWWNQFFKY